MSADIRPWHEAETRRLFGNVVGICSSAYMGALADADARMVKHLTDIIDATIVDNHAPEHRARLIDICDEMRALRATILAGEHYPKEGP